MRTTIHLAAIAILAAGIGGAAFAADRDHRQEHAKAGDARTGSDADAGMQAVPHSAGPQDRAQGWRYFSDPQARRAVVISPQGDYYLSVGQGLRWVAGTPA